MVGGAHAAAGVSVDLGVGRVRGARRSGKQGAMKAKYVDGFLLVVPKKKVADYVALAKKAG